MNVNDNEMKIIGFLELRIAGQESIIQILKNLYDIIWFFKSIFQNSKSYLCAKTHENKVKL